MIYLIISLIIFWSYSIAFKVWNRSSISSTFWNIKYPFLFRLFSIGISIPIMIYSVNQGIDITNWPYVLLFLSGLLISGMGVAAGRKNFETESSIHATCATGGIILGSIYLLLQAIILKFEFYKSIDLYFLIIMIALLIYIFKKPVKHPTTWAEITPYSIIILNEIIKNLI